MLLNWPDVELVAVTTNSDDQGRRAGYARYALDLAGRTDIAVAAGADVSLDCYRVRPGLPDEAVYWPEPILPVPTPLDQALSLLERSIDQGAIIVAIGAFTNLALLEKRSPSSSPDRPRPLPGTRITRRVTARRAPGCRTTPSISSMIRWPAPSRWAGTTAWRCARFH